MWKYKIVEHDREHLVCGMTENKTIVELLNANGDTGWELVCFDDSLDDGKRYFYFKKNT